MGNQKNDPCAGEQREGLSEQKKDNNNVTPFFANVKGAVKVRLLEYLRAKGIEPNDAGFIKCLWHEDKNPSCKVNDERGYVHCFPCNESADIYKVAAALLVVPCDKEHFREIANEVERTLNLPEWQPPKQRRKSCVKLSQSVVYRSELLKEFAKALDAGDMGQAYYKAHLLFALFMLPEGEPEPKEAKKPTLQERMAGCAGYGRGGAYE
jgi:hypothetical protein